MWYLYPLAQNEGTQTHTLLPKQTLVDFCGQFSQMYLSDRWTTTTALTQQKASKTALTQHKKNQQHKNQ